MNIKSAAAYMNEGYRVRRSSWATSDFLLNGQWIFELSINDLLADDWEVIIEGIKSYFPIEYE